MSGTSKIPMWIIGANKGNCMKKVLLPLLVALAAHADGAGGPFLQSAAFVSGNESLGSGALHSNLSLKEAIEIVKKENLEIRISGYDDQIKEYEARIAKGYNYGRLDLIQLAIRSNDAGNVFGFKLQSREASFGDFGAGEFNPADPNVLRIQPHDLNYPDARNHFQTKLSYQIPLYTGGKLTQYAKITEALHQLSKLDTSKTINAKIYETKKTFHDISLLEGFKKNLTIIHGNIAKLEETVKSMVEEGYAKKTDLLEVESRKADVERLLNQVNANEELAYQFLSFLLNRDVSSIELVDGLVPLPSLSDEEMLKRNLDIQKAQKGLEITQMAVKLQKAGFLPELGAFAEYSSADDKFANDFSDHDAYTVGFQFKWNLFNGMIDDNAYEKAKTENMKMKSQVELARKGIALAIAKTKTEIKSFDFDIESLEKELELANAIYENYLERYKEKLVSINDLLIKHSQQLEKVLKLQEAKNKRNERVFELEKIINGVSYE